LGSPAEEKPYENMEYLFTYVKSTQNENMKRVGQIEVLEERNSHRTSHTPFSALLLEHFSSRHRLPDDLFYVPLMKRCNTNPSKKCFIQERPPKTEGFKE
jgi:hypothetical protein